MFRPRFRTLDVPRRPAGVLARGPAAARLAARLARRLEGRAASSGLRAVVCAAAQTDEPADDFLVVLGDDEPLLWCPGCEYLAPAVAGPELWLPTTVGFDVADELVARALLAELGPELFPAALLPCCDETFEVIPLKGAGPVDPQRLLQRFRLPLPLSRLRAARDRETGPEVEDAPEVEP